MSLERIGEILERLPGLTCLHCGAGRDAHTVGLVWDSSEQDWRCLICGYRAYEKATEPEGLNRDNEPATFVADSDLSVHGEGG